MSYTQDQMIAMFNRLQQALIKNAIIEEYDTADRWHVRKFANGIVEMSFTILIENMQITNPWGTLFYQRIEEQYTYPIQLKRLIKFDAKVCNVKGSVFSAIPLTPTPLTETPRFDLLSGVQTVHSGSTYITVTGLEA